MRPICFLILLLFLIPVGQLAQNPVAHALKITDWPDNRKIDEGIGWSIFSKQYYSVSNWNLTGLAVNYASGQGRSAAVICRDGIPGFSWYHVYLSHYQQFKKLSAMLLVRFSFINLKDRPMVLRLGGNMTTNWLVNNTLMLQVRICDIQGWIFPAAATMRGDPLMQVMVYHEPGRLVGLAGGFQVSQLQFGPVTAGIRVNVNDQVGLTGLVDVLPFGISVGMSYQFQGFALKGWLGQRNGLGLSPVVEGRW